MALSETPPPALQAELCPADAPLALLPVRLETRFFAVTGGMELRIRVYPDKIHLDSHEVELTTAERQWGVHFWEQCWRAGGIPDHEARAWRQLAERYGGARAGWIARVLRPANPRDRPTAPVPPDLPLAPPPVFPEVARAPAGEDAAWRRAPLARLLPERWIALAYNNGVVSLTATGRDIQLPLAVGPDPSPDARPSAAGDDKLAIDAGMRWMVDFDEAEARGMGLRMVLFMRDEMANMAWAIERAIESPLEQAVRRDDPQSAAAAPPPALPARPDGIPHYDLSSDVPAHWVPLLPVQLPVAAGQVLTRLKRGAVLVADGSQEVRHALGEILNAGGELLLRDEEVPREGARVTRHYELARWIDGSTLLWPSRRKQVGRGEGSSGLRYDRIVEPDAPSP